MRKPINNLHLAVASFTKALHDYQSAACTMNQALIRLTQHNRSFCKELKRIVTTTQPSMPRQAA